MKEALALGQKKMALSFHGNLLKNFSNTLKLK